MECKPEEIWKSLLLSSQPHSRYLRTMKVNSGELWGNGQWRELPSTGGRRWTPASALRFLRTQRPQYSQRWHRSYFQTCLRADRLTPANPPRPLLTLFVESGDMFLDPVGFGGLRRWDCQSGWPRLGWGICSCYSAPRGLRGPAVVSCSPWQLRHRE